MRAALTHLRLVLVLALPGCAFGPHALEGSHGRYNEAVRTVNEEQLLPPKSRLRALLAKTFTILLFAVGQAAR